MSSALAEPFQVYCHPLTQCITVGLGMGLFSTTLVEPKALKHILKKTCEVPSGFQETFSYVIIAEFFNLEYTQELKDC